MKELIKKIEQEKVVYAGNDFDEGWNGAIDYIIIEIEDYIEEKMKQKCNCWIGFIYGFNCIHNMYLDDYIEMIKIRFAKSDKFYSNNIMNYLYKHKDNSTLFNYCPLCGKRIDWRKLKERLKNETNS